MVLLPGCPCCGECVGPCVQMSATGFTGTGACRVLQSVLTYGSHSVGTVNGATEYPVLRSRSGEGLPGVDVHTCGAVFEWDSQWYTSWGPVKVDSVHVKAVLEINADVAKLTIDVTPTFGGTVSMRRVYRKTEPGVSFTRIVQDDIPVTFGAADIIENVGPDCGGGTITFSKCRCRLASYGRYINDWLYGGRDGSWWDVTDYPDGRWTWTLVIPGTGGVASTPPEVSGRPASKMTRQCRCDTGGATANPIDKDQWIKASSLIRRIDGNGIEVALVTFSDVCDEECSGCAALPDTAKYNVTWLYAYRQFDVQLAWDAGLGAWYGSHTEDDAFGRRYVNETTIQCAGGVWIMLGTAAMYAPDGATVSRWETGRTDLEVTNWSGDRTKCVPKAQTVWAQEHPAFVYGPGSVEIKGVA